MSRKDFVWQLVRIEHWQARIWKIYDSLKVTRGPLEPVPNIPEECYNVGKSHHNPIDIANFIKKHSGDPALQQSHPAETNAMGETLSAASTSRTQSDSDAADLCAEFQLTDWDALEWELGAEAQSSDSDVDTTSDDDLSAMCEMYGSNQGEDISD
ncbi:hypothetical protein EDC04DRAFT_2910029 [Pisolithus marmoratus]|nr:hypothetical protein EDC04DRAFT_2910029 [Pisolithus marmoratus]